MRDLLIQGMRRNGTTVLFDAFVNDPRFATFYEPLSAVRDTPIVGGGSGLHQRDLFADVQEVRAEFVRLHPDHDPSIFNHGGPTRPEVELDPRLPEPTEAYLQLLFECPRPTVTKFVRMTAKVEALGRLAPDAVLIWCVRDPRRVVRSYLLGRDGQWAGRYPSDDSIFETRTIRDPWSVHRLSEAVIERDGLTFDPPLTDAERVVLVWGASVKSTEIDGPRVFGDRAMRVRHEDFCADPAGVLAQIFELLESRPDPDVISWCRSSVRAPGPWAVDNDSRWSGIFERLGLAALVAELGY